MGLIIEIFSSYIIACIVTQSTLFEGIRFKIKKLTHGSILDKKPKHFIECRFCVGFWVSLLICVLYKDIANILMVYGASYFLATQER